MQTKSALVPPRDSDGNYTVESLIPADAVPAGLRAKIVSIWVSSTVHAGYVFKSGTLVGEPRLHLSTAPFFGQCRSGHFFIGKPGDGVEVENRTTGNLSIEVEYELVAE